MRIEDYGTVEVTLCDECRHDEIQREWDVGIPDWMFKDEQGDINLRAGPEYLAWHQAHNNTKKCLQLDSGFHLCPDHLRALADLIERN